MLKRSAILAVFVSLVFVTPAMAKVTFYGSAGPEQAQLQAWVDASRVPTPTVPVRLYEGNCDEGRPEGSPPERAEIAGQEASTIQTCASLAIFGSLPTAYNQAIYIPHMSWHPQYPSWWWHLNMLNEIGHVYDMAVGDRDRHREKFSSIFNYDPRWWWPVNTWATINTAWEKWSMAFAFCGYGMNYATMHRMIRSELYSGFGFDPTISQYRKVCRMMRHLPAGPVATHNRGISASF